MTRAITFDGVESQKPRRLCFGEVLDELSRDELSAAYEKRRKILPSLGGSLYPSILLAEMDEIRERLR